MIKIPGTDPASRHAAAELREHIESMWRDNPERVITIDLSEVEGISGGYADELFAVLYVKYGPLKFWERLRIREAKMHIAKAINGAIHWRVCHEMNAGGAKLLYLRPDLESVSAGMTAIIPSEG